MPFRKIRIPPGIDRESTSQSGTPSWYESENVRWVDSYPQTIGGWVRDETYTLQGTVRGIASWTDFSNNQYRCVGTTSKFYIIVGSNTYDITPERNDTTPTNKMSVEDGSSIITMEDSSNGASVGDFVFFESMASADLGGIDDSVFEGRQDGFKIESVIDDDKYTFDCGTTADSQDLNAGGALSLRYKVSSGSSVTVSGTGWGVGTWGGDDVTPKIYDMATPDPVATITNGDATLTIDVTGYSGTAFTTSDYIYPIGLTGTIDDIDLTFLNNKWWPVGSLDGTDPQIEYVTTADGGPTSGGGAGRTFYHYSDTDGEVKGATRPWNEPATTSVEVAQMRTMSIQNFGEDIMFCYRGGPIYYYDISANSSGGVISRDPDDVAKRLDSFTGEQDTPDRVDSFIVSNSHGHTIAFGCNDIGLESILNNMLIRWSDRNNPFSWLPAVGNEAGGEVLRYGSEILGAVQTKDEIMVFTDTALYSMRYVGFPEVYGVNLISSDISSYSRMSSVAVGNSVYFMGNEQFYEYNGSVRSLPKKLSNYVFSTINSEQRGKVFAALNSAFTEVIWFYPDGKSFEPNRYVFYNYGNGTWGMGTYDMTEVGVGDVSDSYAGTPTGRNRTAWLDSGVFSEPMAAFVLEYDPTAATPVETSALFRHESGTSADASPITHSVQSSEVGIDEGENYSFYDKIVPDIEVFDVGIGIDPTITVSVHGRDLPGRTENSFSSDTSVTVDFSTQSDSSVNYAPNFNKTSIRGRAKSVSFTVSSDESGFSWRLGDTRIRFKPDGRD